MATKAIMYSTTTRTSCQCISANLPCQSLQALGNANGKPHRGLPVRTFGLAKCRAHSPAYSRNNTIIFDYMHNLSQGSPWAETQAECSYPRRSPFLRQPLSTTETTATDGRPCDAPEARESGTVLPRHGPVPLRPRSLLRKLCSGGHPRGILYARLF